MPDRAKTKKVRKARAPVTDVQSGKGYSGIGKKYDDYGNPMPKGDTAAVETVFSEKNRKLKFRHVMGAKRGPRSRSMRGVSD